MYKCVGNKHEELEISVQVQGYDLVEITERWWDGLHPSLQCCNDSMPYRLFRKDSLGR